MVDPSPACAHIGRGLHGGERRGTAPAEWHAPPPNRRAVSPTTATTDGSTGQPPQEGAAAGVTPAVRDRCRGGVGGGGVCERPFLVCRSHHWRPHGRRRGGLPQLPMPPPPHSSLGAASPADAGAPTANANTERSEVKAHAAAPRGTPGACRLQAVACGGLRDALAARSCPCRPDDPPAATRGGGGEGRRAKGTRHPGGVLCANRAGRGAAAPGRHLHDEQDALPVQRSPPTSAIR